MIEMQKMKRKHSPVFQTFVMNADFRLSGLYLSNFSIPDFYKFLKIVVNLFQCSDRFSKINYPALSTTLQN